MRISLLIEKHIIRECLENNRHAQRMVYQRLLPYLTGVCKRYLRNNTDIQDALQESFVNVFKSIESYDASKSEFHTWATRITINCSLKLNARHYKFESEQLPEDSPQLSRIPCVIEKMDNEELLNYLQKMPEAYLTVFNLNIVDGYSHKEISEILGIHESLSRKRLSRAKTWIRERLTREGEVINQEKSRI